MLGDPEPEQASHFSVFLTQKPPSGEYQSSAELFRSFPFAQIIIRQEQEESADRLQSRKRRLEISWNSLVSDGFFFCLTANIHTSRDALHAKKKKENRELLKGPSFDGGWEIRWENQIIALCNPVPQFISNPILP